MHVVSVSSGLEALTRTVQYVDVSALLLSGWFFTCKPRPAVQEYGEGEHDLYGGDA